MVSSSRDRPAFGPRQILFTAAFLRALAVGMMAVLIGLYCARLGLSAVQIGAVLSAALWGAALAALATLLAGPRFTERVVLVALCTLPILGCLVLLSTDAFPVLVGAAFVGMFNVNGRDRGAIPILEQTLLPATTSEAGRTRVFAWYNVLLDTGYAAGGLLAALPTLLESAWGLAPLAAMKATLALFCVCYGLAAALYARLPARVGAAEPARLRDISPASRPIIAKLGALFFLDALAGGFVGSAIFAYWFSERFEVAAAAIAALFAAGRLLAASSHLAAAWLAARIGLLNTMVFTHIPSSLLLFTIALSDHFALAAALFLLRESLNEMDVPTRQSYVMAVVQPAERLAAAGVTSLVRAGGWALAPVFAGGLMQAASLAMPLLIAGGAKIAYDLLLWREFRRVRPPEER